MLPTNLLGPDSSTDPSLSYPAVDHDVTHITRSASDTDVLVESRVQNAVLPLTEDNRTLTLELRQEKDLTQQLRRQLELSQAEVRLLMEKTKILTELSVSYKDKYDRLSCPAGYVPDKLHQVGKLS